MSGHDDDGKRIAEVVPAFEKGDAVIPAEPDVEEDQRYLRLGAIQECGSTCWTVGW